MHRITPNWNETTWHEKWPIQEVLRPAGPRFHPFHPMISRFQDIAHFMIFPSTLMLNFRSAPNEPQTELKWHDMKSSQYMYQSYTLTWLPIFHLLHSTASRFQVITLYDFPIDSHDKISKCYNFFKTLPIAKKSTSLYSTMVTNVFMNFCWHWMKTGGVAFENFQPHVVLC